MTPNSISEKQKPPGLPAPRLRQIDMTRALKAAQAAGLTVAGFEIDRASGRLLVTTAGGGASLSSADAAYAQWEAAHAARKNKGR